jgi:hypothetical protein
VQKAIAEVAKGREVASVYREGNFGKRPNVLNHPGDVMQAVAEGAVSFHGSVEHWSNPMKLDVGMSRQDQDELRIGWDIFIDPDIPDFELAKVVVRQILEALKDHGVTNFSVKFSGGKSFHIGIPFSSMPESVNMQPLNHMYPELLQKIVEFLKWYMRDQLKEALLSIDTPNIISQRVNKPLAHITDENGLDPFKVVNMDVFSSRHLFRLPYSLHEKSLLVSLPIKPEKLERFEKDMARPEKVRIDEKFLVPGKSRDAQYLIIQAMDWASKNIPQTKELVFREKKLETRNMMYISENLFPPCIKHILENGLADGRKRGVFILINFLRNMGWNADQIEKKIEEWNNKNTPPLSSSYLRGQLRWHFRTDKPLLPPNCNNENYYKQLGLHGMCQSLHEASIKNPVSYPFRLIRSKSGGKRKQWKIRTGRNK